VPCFINSTLDLLVIPKWVGVGAFKRVIFTLGTCVANRVEENLLIRVARTVLNPIDSGWRSNHGIARSTAVMTVVMRVRAVGRRRVLSD